MSYTNDWPSGLCGCCGGQEGFGGCCSLPCWWGLVCPCYVTAFTQVYIQKSKIPRQTDVPPAAYPNDCCDPCFCTEVTIPQCFFSIPPMGIAVEYFNRRNIETIGAYEGEHGPDCCKTICCFPCVVCQDARQINHFINKSKGKGKKGSKKGRRDSSSGSSSSSSSSSHRSRRSSSKGGKKGGKKGITVTIG